MESSGLEGFFRGMLKMLGEGLKGPGEEGLKVLVIFVGSWGGFKAALGSWEGCWWVLGVFGVPVAFFWVPLTPLVFPRTTVTEEYRVPDGMVGLSESGGILEGSRVVGGLPENSGAIPKLPSVSSPCSHRPWRGADQ